jgi:hypothetical protein
MVPFCVSACLEFCTFIFPPRDWGVEVSCSRLRETRRSLRIDRREEPIHLTNILTSQRPSTYPIQNSLPAHLPGADECVAEALSRRHQKPTEVSKLEEY